MNIFVRSGILMLVVLALAGCIASPASQRAPILGVVVDEALQVVDIVPGGAAEAAGLQVGDVLLDLTWIPSSSPDTPRPSDIGEEIFEEADASDVVTDVVPLPAPTVPLEQYMETATVPFTDRTRAITLIGAGLPLKLRIQREGQILELTITANYNIFDALTEGTLIITPQPEKTLSY